MKKRVTAFILTIFPAVCHLSVYGSNPITEGSTVTSDETEIISETSENAADFLGDIASDGYQLNFEKGTLTAGAKVEVTSVQDTSKYENDDKYELIGTVFDISSDSYQGETFGTDVKFTVPVPEGIDDPGRYVFLYFDEAGNVAYMLPDEYNTSDGTMSIYLPHFSCEGAAKLTESEQIEMYLNQYATQAAVAKAENQQAAADLEPYVKAKIKALGLSEEAGKELVYSVINYIGGQCGDDVGMYTDLVTTAYKSIDKEDASDFNAKMEEIISGKLYDMINYNVANGKADSKFKDAGKLGTILGAVAGGDTRTAMKEIGDAIGSAVPGIGLTNKAAEYIGAKVNETFTNWKSNQIEALYQKYKNGYKDYWGNEVIAEDEESLKTYLYTSSGLSWSKGVYRFYNMDKTAEICEKYGWGKKTYEELDEHYRAEFDRRAEEGLLNYFRTRKAQEDAAAQIKEKERVCVEEMLKINGCLVSGNYNKFFGEQSKDDYDLTARLDRIMRVRTMLQQYVDEDALAKSQKELGADGYNWGFLMNNWAALVTEKGYEEGKKAFLEDLKNWGLLNKSYAAEVPSDQSKTEDTKSGTEAEETEETEAEETKAEETEAEETEETEAEAEYAWCLVNTDVYQHDDLDDAYIEHFSASETSRTYTIAGKNNYADQKGSFTASCDAPPEIIYADEEFSMHLSLTASGKSDYCFLADAWITMGGLKLETRDGKGTFTVGTYEGADHSFDVNVYGVYGEGGEGAALEIKFCACQSDTIWTYEWRKVEN